MQFEFSYYVRRQLNFTTGNREDGDTMKLSVRSLAATAMAVALAAAQPAAADVPESTDPIKIVTNNWTSQLVLANVVGQLLQKMGYNVEYKPSDTQLQFTAIANGDMDFQVEVWEGSMWHPSRRRWTAAAWSISAATTP